MTGSLYRYDAHARITIPEHERLVDGTLLQLVRVVLSNDGPVVTRDGQEVTCPEVICALRPGQARELAHQLLALADHAATTTGPGLR